MKNSIIEIRVTELCTKAKLRPTVAMTNAGVGKEFFRNLREGRTPSAEKIEKLADYFNVTTDFILGRSDNPRKTDLTKNQPERPIFRELIEIVENLNDLELNKVTEYAQLLQIKRLHDFSSNVDSDIVTPEMHISSFLKSECKNG